MEPHLYSWAEGEAGIINPVPATLSESVALPQEDELSPGLPVLIQLSTSPDTVPNLYEVKGLHFLYHLTYGQVKARTDIPLSSSNPKFEVRLVTGQFSELGINYLGKILVGVESSTFIRLVGTGSYDPAGLTSSSLNSECLREDVVIFLLSYTESLLKAAQLGASEDSIDRLKEVTSAIMAKYFKRPLLLEWMTLQVKQACFKQRSGISYAEFLLQKANCGEVDLTKQGQEHTKEYLERYSRWKLNTLPESKVFPGYQYYQVRVT